MASSSTSAELFRMGQDEGNVEGAESSPDWSWEGGHQKRLETLLFSKFLSDTSVLVGSSKKEYKVHRLFLQIGSPVLYKRLLQKETTLVLEEIETEDFEWLLKYLYFGKVEEEQDLSMAMSMLKISTDLEICDLVQLCTGELKRKLNEQNVLQIYQHAMECGDKELIEDALVLLCQNGMRIVETDDFAKLSAHCLYELLKRDDLCVKNELQLFKAVMKWGEAECVRNGSEPGDLDSIRKALYKALGFIRFPLIDQTDFTLNVALKSLLSTEELVSILLCFTVPLESRHLIPPGRFTSSPRTYHNGA